MDFGYNRKYNLLIGVSVYLPEFFHRWPKIFKLSWKSYEYLGMIWIIVQIISFAIMISFSYDEINVLCTAGGGVLYLMQIPVKMAIIKMNEENFNKTVKNISEISMMLCKNPIKDSNYPKLFEKYYKRVKIVIPAKAGIEFGTFVILALFYLIKGLFYDNPDERQIPGPMWPRIGFEDINVFVCYLFFQSFAGICGLLRNTALDVFFCTLLIIISTQLKYLKQIQKKMIEEYEERKGKIFSMDELGGNRKEEAERNNIKELEEDLRWWTEAHQKILRSVSDLKPITSPYLALIYFAMMAEMFVVGVITVSASSWNTMQKCMIIAIIATNVFQLFIISVIGDVLEEDAFKVTDDGFTVPLLSSSKFIRKSYLFMVSRGKIPLQVKAAKISPLSAYTFGKLARITFGYFVTIVQVRQGRRQENPIAILN